MAAWRDSDGAAVTVMAVVPAVGNSGDSDGYGNGCGDGSRAECRFVKEYRAMYCSFRDRAV